MGDLSNNQKSSTALYYSVEAIAVLREYVKKIDKTECGNCIFNINKNLRARPVVVIPPPDTLQVILISRDPTVDFIPIYNYSKRYSENERRKILFAAAIPQLLLTKILRFLRRENMVDFIEENLDRLYEIMFESTYWTHLHKCPTDSKNKFSTKCANMWLKNEIIEAQKEGARIIVCLGKEVENWVRINALNRSFEIIHLPHPSNANNATWYSKDRIKKREIKENIVKLCKLISNL